MKRFAAFLYGVIAYSMFLVVFLYAIGFVGDLIVPKTVDTGATAPLGTALAIDVALLLLFAVQHSGMARPGFKRWWTRIVPRPIERSTFVVFASVVLAFVMWQWRPIPAEVWNLEGTAAAPVLEIGFWIGWLVVLLVTFNIDHFDLFGLRQVTQYLKGRQYRPPHLKITAFYRFVRHPLYLGFMLAFWSTPRMTIGHLLFAVATTGYMLVAIQLEERDLVTFHGPAYADYRTRVRMIVPLPKAGSQWPAPRLTPEPDQLRDAPTGGPAH